MLQPLIILAPLGALAYYSSQGIKSDQKAEKDTAKNRPNGSWVSDNTWVYLEDPLGGPRTYPGDYMEYDLQAPYGPVQKSMETAKTPVQALAILGDYSARKDNVSMNAWTEYVKPKREIAERDLTMPITQVVIAQAGSQPDREIKLGSRFYDRPVPRWTGTDRYYKRKVTIPWYLTP
jgi:hypothetical protein